MTTNNKDQAYPFNEGSHLQGLLLIVALMEQRQYDRAERQLKEHIATQIRQSITAYANASVHIGLEVQEILEDALASIKKLPL